MLLLLAQLAFVGSPACQSCHRNIYRRYEPTAMARAGGVACEACHGPGSMHAQGSGRMIVPDALPPPERDAICGQCHLKGAEQVGRRGQSLARFRPGTPLTRYAATFVDGQPRSPVEQLAVSVCHQKAGDGLWCGTCHDVHSGKTDRSACAQCHTAKQCARGPDCATCHMPGNDHRILRKPSAAPPAGWQLRPFTPADAGARELGIAYAQRFMKTGDPRQRQEAERLLAGLSVPDPVAAQWLRRLRSQRKP